MGRGKCVTILHDFLSALHITPRFYKLSRKSNAQRIFVTLFQNQSIPIISARVRFKNIWEIWLLQLCRATAEREPK